MKRWVLPLSFLAVFGLGILAGQLLPLAQAGATNERSAALSDSDRAYAELSVFAEALHHIRTQHLDPPSVDTLIAHAIDGMTQALDPYSEHLSEARSQILLEDSDGAYEGIGIILQTSDDGPRIERVMPASPADRQGLRVGDVVLRINDHEVSNDSMAQLIEQIRGGDSRDVTLRIQRDEKILDVEVERKVIEVQALEQETLEDGTLWLRLRYFDAQTQRRVADALKAHRRSQGADAGVLLDLRQNPGGLFTEAIALTQHFLREGVIVRVDDGEARGRHVWQADAKKVVYEGPLVVLIDEYSASSAEIVASALQENGRATVIGERSFGKGTVQRLFELSDRSALKLTVSAYYSPNDHCIDGLGVVPDLRPAPLEDAHAEAEKANARAEESCRGHTPNPRIAQVRVPQESDDPARRLALEVLREGLPPVRTDVDEGAPNAP